MNLVQLGDFELKYTTLESINYGAGGQLYGTMEGTIRGDRLQGRLELTNLARRRSDDVNVPTLRGLLRTNDGATIWVEMNGLARLRPEDKARVFVSSFVCRTAEQRYDWLNTTFAVIEGVLDAVGVGGVARGRAYACEPNVGLSGSR